MPKILNGTKELEFWGWRLHLYYPSIRFGKETYIGFRTLLRIGKDPTGKKCEGAICVFGFGIGVGRKIDW